MCICLGGLTRLVQVYLMKPGAVTPVLIWRKIPFLFAWKVFVYNPVRSDCNLIVRFLAIAYLTSEFSTEGNEFGCLAEEK